MATQLQLRQDTAADLVSVTPVQGEPGYDQTNKRLLAGDGSRAQGVPHANFWDVQNQTFLSGTAVGAGSPEDPDDLSLTISDGTLGYAPTAYATFQKFAFKMTAAGNNTGAVTLNVAALGAKTIKKYDAAGSKIDLEAGDLVAGNLYTVTYDGTHFVLGVVVGGGSGGMELLAETEISGTPSSLTFEDSDGMDWSSYAAFRIQLGVMHSTNARINVTMSQSGTYETGGTDYRYAMHGAVFSNGAANAASSIPIPNASQTFYKGGSVFDEGFLIDAVLAEKISNSTDVMGAVLFFQCHGGNSGGSGNYGLTNGAGFLRNGVNSQIDGIKFALSSGTMLNGYFRVWGLSA